MLVRVRIGPCHRILQYPDERPITIEVYRARSICALSSLLVIDIRGAFSENGSVAN